MQAGKRSEIHIHTPAQPHDYDVIIDPGALDRLDQYAQQHAPAHTYALISDNAVASLYGERATQALQRTGARIVKLQFPPGERSKNAWTWGSLCDQLIANNAGRDTCVISLGGGVTTDLAGFVAAAYMRGLPLIQVPTTLLAMIDAAIGGKTGIDTAGGKNLIGAFHQPSAVVIDPLLLHTLPVQELRYGLAEAVKHGAIADANYLAWIEASAGSFFDQRTHTLASLIARSIEIKAHFVSADINEKGARAALNFGHTVGHALESVSDYAVPHGHAVALGMIVESVAGEAAGVTEPGTAQALRAVLAAVGLPTVIDPATDRDAVMVAMRADKKVRADEQRFTLLERIGEVARDGSGHWTTTLPIDVVKDALV